MPPQSPIGAIDATGDGGRISATGASCVAFLKWALPRLGLAWPGFHRVHRRVCKRLGRRFRELHLPDAFAYRAHLESHPAEWSTLDAFCRIPISRFYRDAEVFERLTREILPILAAKAGAGGVGTLRCWSAGCASGEEAYTVNILWQLAVAPRFPGVVLTTVATDVDAALLARARAARYRASSLRELPADWRDIAFVREGDDYVLRPAFRINVLFIQQDLRQATPSRPFDLILCRNLAFTYFDEAQQRSTVDRIIAALSPGGAFVIGRGEQLPRDIPNLLPWLPEFGIYRAQAD